MECQLNLEETNLEGVQVAETKFISDNRGAFARLFCDQELGLILKERKIVQINFSVTNALGSVRGLHYQKPPHSELKLVRCIKGRVWDVAVDLRSGSNTFLEWHAEELSADNGKMLVIPEGCAHGFQTLEPSSEMLYLHTNYYAPHAEGGIAFDEPLVNISWPLSITDISARDKGHVKLTDYFKGIGV